jgi:hypothetical protein
LNVWLYARMFDYVQISDNYSQGRTIGMVLNPTGFFNLFFHLCLIFATLQVEPEAQSRKHLKG